MTVMKSFKGAMIGVAVLSLGACANVEYSDDFAAMDPYEDTNRAIHSFNVALDRNVLQPVSQGYDFVTPATFKLMLGNGFDHLTEPVNMVNHFLQGEPMSGAQSFGRIAINTLVGMGGFLDPATDFGLPREETDFGVTLGKWGVESGPYLVLPFLGPTTGRDIGGFVVDSAFAPMTYLSYVPADVTVMDSVVTGVRVTDLVDSRHRNADLIDEVLYESLDSYVTLRSVYLQRRRALVSNGIDDDTLPSIFDEEETN
ncbi:MAG: VacJ family lipoprotein [Alphaproteobacteria bacterium]|nr:VacJ family lipoprotein [Alphaproteobacteria bacterium]